MTTFRHAYQRAQRLSRKKSTPHIVVNDDLGGYKSVTLEEYQGDKNKIMAQFDQDGEQSQ